MILFLGLEIKMDEWFIILYISFDYVYYNNCFWVPSHKIVNRNNDFVSGFRNKMDNIFYCYKKLL